jgi:two-component system, sporulation sensor kinase D
MNLYESQSRIKVLFLLSALMIVVISLVYTNWLASDLAEQERNKVKLWADAYRNLNLADENTDIGFLFEVIRNNNSVPMILTDGDDNIIDSRNLDSLKAINDPNYLPNQLFEMKGGMPPIEIEISPGDFNYIYYKDSFQLVQLRYFPWIQLGVIALFVVVGYITLSTTRVSEQNRLWVGMAKETAHQLGTPISSLMAWVEYLRETAPEQEHVTMELEKDVNRLEIIAERFSKIGSKPGLEPHDIKEMLGKSINYIETRVSNQVNFEINLPDNVQVLLNPPLFEWVMENLLKNALDAMEGIGTITISAYAEDGKVNIDIADTGKGIPKGKSKMVFQPGFSTKKRGWGLGLALAKRIVEQYHGGKIFVKETAENKGTTFRVVLALS